MHIHGIIPPVATPMRPNEDLDLPRLRWFLDRLIDAGVHGIFVLGTNSEFYALDESEKQQVIATAVEHVRGRVPVYAGTGAETTREVVRLTQMAEREGGQGASIITPYFVAAARGDWAAAKAAQRRLNPIRLGLTLGTAPGAVKAALQLMGLSIGPCRSPVSGLTPANQQKMRAALTEAGLLS